MRRSSPTHCAVVDSGLRLVAGDHQGRLPPRVGELVPDGNRWNCFDRSRDGGHCIRARCKEEH